MSDARFETAATTAKSRRWWPMVLLLAIVALIVYTVGIYLYSKSQLAQAEAEADRLDPHWRLEEIEARRPKPPDEQNSALAIMAIKAKLPANFPDFQLEEQIELPPPPHRLSATQLAALAKIMQSAEPGLADARNLVNLPAGRFPIKWSPDAIGTLLTCQDARVVIRLLHWDVIDRLHHDDPAGAVSAWRAGFNTNRAVGDEPILISQLIRIALQAISLNDLERMLALAEFSEPQLASIQHELAINEANAGLLAGLRGERAISQVALKHMQDNRKGLSITGGGSDRWLYWLSLAYGGIPNERAKLLRHMNKAVEVVKKKDVDHAELKQWENEGRDLPPVSKLLVPAITKMFEADLRIKAQVRSAIGALAAERFRLRQNRWPKNWEELVAAKLLPEPPKDPYDLKPLRFKVTEDGLVIYAVGLDRKDNGGAINRENRLAADTDLGFQLWNVDQRRQPPLPDKPKSPPVNGDQAPPAP